MLIDSLNAASNGVVGASCFIMAYQLLRFLIKRWRDDIPFRATIVLAIALFFFGGMGRLVLTVIIHNDTWDAVVKIMTALVSVLTAILITLSVNQALTMKTPRDYEQLEAQKDRELQSLRRELKLLSR